VDNEELEAFNTTVTIKVIGSGGAGNNTLTTLQNIGIQGAELIAANTDAQDLLDTSADSKILLGKNLLHGLGAGNDPLMGEKAALESVEMIGAAVHGSDICFVVGGLGGGTGTGSIPVIAQETKRQGILTVAIVSLPFQMEGQRRWENAMEGVRKLETLVDALILLPNEKLMHLAQDLPLLQAFKLSDEISAQALKGIIEVVTVPGLVNLDFADLIAVLKNTGAAVIGIGESDTTNRPIEAAQSAMHNPLVEANVRGATGGLVNIIGGPDMTLSEAREAVDQVRKVLTENARLIWGTHIDETMQGKMKVMVILTGLSSKTLLDSYADDGYVEVDELL